MSIENSNHCAKDENGNVSLYNNIIFKVIIFTFFLILPFAFSSYIYNVELFSLNGFFSIVSYLLTILGIYTTRNDEYASKIFYLTVSSIVFITSIIIYIRFSFLYFDVKDIMLLILAFISLIVSGSLFYTIRKEKNINDRILSSFLSIFGAYFALVGFIITGMQ